MRKYLLISCLLVTSNVSALGWSDWTKVISIKQGLGQNPVFKLESSGVAGTGCASQGYIHVLNIDINSGSKRQFSLLTTALLSGRMVKVNTNSCASDYPNLSEIEIK